MNKAQLRKLYKKKRLSLSTDEVQHKSVQIANNLLQLNIWHYDYYHLFLPIKKWNEVDTQPIMNILMSKDKNIVISHSDFDSIQMINILLEEQTVIKENKYGIPEPINGERISGHLMDVVFVPLLITDQKGYRVGYGKGFYDRFLANCRSNVLKIGISFFEPINEIEDVHEMDVTLDMVVTPEKIYRITKND
ncbi:5-formyltetrahydrofolate cyclo-ligase [Nonlabens tegetincola]|uniref:5-formyltetrahydrofolate cyclo-ligase n=1 Tax=Nonlabens tegetincola TaxID=323273 RepID=UPI000A204504|nr:5-formyltetrahydrofolate cyclo-ligase [Nonlabens tegetincola]ARN72389.1 5-formyltetrahydrofolate cyclo-ligase [Nonlabens tegetincola]